MGDCYRVCAIVCALFFPPIAVLMVLTSKLISKPITIFTTHMSTSLIPSVQPFGVSYNSYLLPTQFCANHG